MRKWTVSQAGAATLLLLIVGPGQNEEAPAMEALPMPLYEPVCVLVFYRGAPAPGAPVFPTPLFIYM